MTRLALFSPRLTLTLAATLAFSCSKSEDAKETSSAGGTMSTVALPNQLNIQNETLGLTRNAALLKNPRVAAAGLSMVDAAAVFGHSLADGIVSLKYRISSMELCGKSDGSKGDACDSGPFQIYGEEGTGDYDTFVPGAASVKNFTGWTDFMKKGALEDLIGKVTYTDTQVGTYEAVIVRFYRTFKVNANILLNNGVKLYTKDVTDFFSNNKTGLDVTYAGKNDTMTTEPSVEGTFFLPNGGKTFFLQRPFEITADDLKNLVPYKMALAFDHANFVKGAATAPGSLSTNPPDFMEGQVDDAQGYAIRPGFLEFAPILARESETIMRETYILSTNGIPVTDASLGNQPFSARVTFYYVKEDASKAVRAVTSMAYYNEYSTGYLNFNPVGGIRNVKDGSVAGTIDVLQGNAKIALFKGFKRLTTVGDSGTVSGEICMSGSTAAGCNEAAKAVDWVYTFVGASEADTALSIQAVTPPPPPADPAATTP